MQLKVISLNTWGGHLFTPLLEFLKAEQPDILLAQEVYNGEDPSLPEGLRLYSRLTEDLSFASHVFAPAFGHVRPEGTIVRGNAIFAHFPLTEYPSHFFSVPFNPSLIEAPPFSTTPYLLQRATLTLPGGPVHLYNVHGLWGADAHDNPERLKMSATILNEIGANSPTILAGDFNVAESSRTIQNIAKTLNNVFAHKIQTTFNLTHKVIQGFVPEVVDYIFVSPHITVTSARVPDADISDHMPLVCEIEIT